MASAPAQREPCDAALPRPWFALASIPVVYGANDEGAEAIAPGTADLLLELHDPPRPSYLALPERLVPNARRRERNDFPRIVAVGSDRLIFMATQGRRDHGYFLCDVKARTAARLPVVPFEMGLKLLLRRNIGLVADPRCPGHYMIAQLHANVMKRRHDALLCYSTATGQWAVKPLASATDHESWGADGVFAHDGLLWWVDIGYGMLVCNPFDDLPHLRFVRLPIGCEIHGPGDRPRLISTSLMDQRRCVRISQGMLRYVEIRGLSYDSAAVNAAPTVSMWTLVNPAGPHPWRFEYEAYFSDIWAHDSYVAAGLPQGKVPNLALVDPNNHGVVYFFQGSTMFSLDVRARRVLACEECLVDRLGQNLEFQYSRFVEAWDWELCGNDPASSDGGSGKKGHDELVSLLSQMEIKNQNSSSEEDREVQQQKLLRDDPVSHGTVLQPPRGRWVILNSTASVSSVQECISFHWEAPPRVSTLSIDAALVPEAQEHPEVTARISAADPSGWLLLEATHGCEITLILCDARKSSAARLPDAGPGRPTPNARSLGLIPEARGGGHCMVAHLEPLCSTRHATLVCYTTRTGVWEEMNLTCAVPLPELWTSDGVIPHAGKLWWFDLVNGNILSCDPLSQQPRLRRVRVPGFAAPTATPTSGEVAKHRCLALSGGKIRLVRVVGPPDSPTIIASTLDSAAGTFVDDYRVPFLEISADPNCTWAELLRKTRPDAIAAIHPKDSRIVCFFENFNGTACIYGVDLENKCAIESQAVEVAPALHSPLAVLAWEPPPALPGGVRSSPSGCNNGKPWSRVGRGLRGVLNFKSSLSGGLQ